MKILYLTENVYEYGGAFYQRDVLNHLKKVHDVWAYGPGFSHYDPSDDIHDIVAALAESPDLICIGHKWLQDAPTTDVDPHPRLKLSESSAPQAMILNKEYTNFDEKIKYAENNNISLVFTHHHNASEWTKEYEPKFVFWPFAVDDSKFQDYEEDKIYDLAFSGILRNPNDWVPQTDLRIQIQRELFYCFSQIKLFQRPKYSGYNIFWRGKPTSRPYILANRVLHRDERLSEKEYKKLYNRSKLAFNTLSPVSLVGTRYYESMASNSLVFCQESNIYSEYGLFEPGEHCITFSEDLSDFEEKFKYWVSHDDERRRIAEQGHQHVIENHTWETRIEEFTQKVTKCLF